MANARRVGSPAVVGSPRASSHQVRPLARLSAGLLCLLLALQLLIVCSEATFFLLGNACVAGLETIRRVAAEPLRQLGLVEGALDVLTDFCSGLARYSIPGILLNDVGPVLERIVEFVAEGGLDVAERLPELVQLINRAASIVTRFENGG